MNDAPVTDLLRQASNKTENHLMDFSYSSLQDCPDIGISTGASIIFYQGGQLTMAHTFQDKLFNQLQEVSTIQHTLNE